jgi:hypothetical protein
MEVEIMIKVEKTNIVIAYIMGVFETLCGNNTAFYCNGKYIIMKPSIEVEKPLSELPDGMHKAKVII